MFQNNAGLVLKKRKACYSQWADLSLSSAIFKSVWILFTCITASLGRKEKYTYVWMLVTFNA